MLLNTQRSTSSTYHWTFKWISVQYNQEVVIHCLHYWARVLDNQIVNETRFDWRCTIWDNDYMHLR